VDKRDKIKLTVAIIALLIAVTILAMYLLGGEGGGDVGGEGPAPESLRIR